MTDTAEAEAEDGKWHWILNHLLRLLYIHNFATELDSAEVHITELLKDTIFADKKEFTYKWHLFRVMVQELLQPLESLTNAQDVAQVFANVVQCEYIILIFGIVILNMFYT